MKRALSTPLVAMLLFCILGLQAMAWPPSEASAAAIGPVLRERIDTARPDEELPVLLSMRDKVDLSRFDQGRGSAGAMIRALQAAAAKAQPPVLQWLADHGIAGRAFWIDNSIACKLGPGLIRELATRDEIGDIEFDVPIYLPEIRTEPLPDDENAVDQPSGNQSPGERTSEEPTSRERRPGGQAAGDQAPRTVYWNLRTIHAPEVWELGLNGTGIVVGSMDSGAEVTHPALAGKWRGGTNSWHDAVNHLPDPYDDNGHGTHTIGTMVGGDGRGAFPEDIGVAYGAQFISAKILDANNSLSSVSVAIEGAQFMLDPDGDPDTDDLPHVINNSWAFGNQLYAGFYESAAAWQAAGIIPVFAIGNEGPDPASTRPPGNYNNVIGVGATTSADEVWTSSSRGPSPTGPIFPHDLRKPEIAAPGADVRSSWRGGGYVNGFGTSMAAPHVAGTVALLLQANPGLTYDEVRAILCQSSQDLGPAGYDYDYGYGRLDALEAAGMVATGIAEGIHAVQPRLRAAPNPFSDRVHLSLPNQTPVQSGAPGLSLRVFSAAGTEVRRIRIESPASSATWDGLDAHGRRVPAGRYYVALSPSMRVGSQSVLLIP